MNGTGDIVTIDNIVTIDEEGYIKITDRTKELIKSNAYEFVDETPRTSTVRFLKTALREEFAARD